MLRFQPGDVFAAYLKRRGFVGVGVITEPAKPIRDVRINAKPLLRQKLSCLGMARNVECDDRCEYVCRVKWVKTVDRMDARFKRRAGLFTSQLVRASLRGQLLTLRFLEQEFDVHFPKLLDNDAA